MLLLDQAGNNLVNADFSLYLGHIFTVKHIYLTLYIAHMCRIAPIYSTPLYLLAPLAVPCSLRSLCRCRSPRCPCGRVAVLAAPVLAPVRSRARVRVRVCVAVVPPARLPVRSPAPVPACSHACLLPRLPAYLRPCPYAWPACSRCSRLYCSFSRRALARCSTLSARRKLF